MTSKLYKSALGLALAAATTISFASGSRQIPPPKPTLRAPDKVISIKFDRLQVRDEDDETTNDELYVILTRFRMKAMVRPEDGKMVATPGTLSIRTQLSSPYGFNLGRVDWAQEGRTYSIPASPALEIRELVPGNEANWVVGSIVTFMEHDNFSPSTIGLLSREIETMARRALTGEALGPKDVERITDSLTGHVASTVGKAFVAADGLSLFRGFAEAVDPDDYGGFQIAMAITLPSNTIVFYSGPPAANPSDAAHYTHPVSNAYRFTMGFPYLNTRGVPFNARYRGGAILQGIVSLSRISFP